MVAKPCKTINKNDNDSDDKNKIKENEEMPKKPKINTTEASFKSKAPTNLLLSPPQLYNTPGDPSEVPGQSPRSPKTLRSPKTPKSPRSPGLMNKFQVVKNGLQFVSHMKPTDKID